MSNQASDSTTRAPTKLSKNNKTFLLVIWLEASSVRDVMWTQQGPLSPQLDEPVEDEEDEEAEEEHVAQEFGLAAPGQLLDPANGGAQQAARGVKIWVLRTITEIRTVQSPARLANKRSDPKACWLLSRRVKKTFP